jgi:flagellar hook assembly protein FlgD
VTWNGKDTFGNFVPSGVYFYEIKAGEQFQKIKKMTLLK